MLMMNSQQQQQQQQQQQRQLVVAVEGTAALGPTWSVLLTEYVEKIVRTFHAFNGGGQKHTGPPGPPGEMALVVFYSHSPSSGCLIQRSGWTSSADVFSRWLSSIHFEGGGFGEAAIAEGLAEALIMLCPGPNVPPVSQATERQRHCLLIATSNPHRLPTPVPSPPVPMFSQQSQGNNADTQLEQWYLADADTVSQAYAPCSVSLSVIAPRQLPLLRNLYSQAKRLSRGSEGVNEPPKVSPQHLVLLSDGFLEARLALHRTAVSNTLSNNVPKIEQHQTVSVNGSSVTNQMPVAGVRPTSGAATGIGSLAGRPGSNMPNPPVTVKTEAGTQGGLNSLLQHNNANNNNNISLPMQQQLPSTGALSNQDTMQSSLTSITSPETQQQQDFKVLGNIPSTQPLRPVGGNTLQNSSLMAHSPSQSRHTIGSPSLPPASPLSGLQSSGVGVPVSNIMSSIAGGANSLSNSQSALGVSGQPVGIGMGSNNTVGMNVGQGGVGAGQTMHSNYTSGSASLVNSQMLGAVQTNPSLVNTGGAGTGQGLGGLGQGTVSGVSGQGGLAPSNQMASGGLGSTMGGQGTSGVNSGTGTMIPTPGVPQSPSQVQSLNSNTGSSHHPPAAAPAQQSLKYTKLWEGILAGQRKGNAVPIPICKLEGYRQTSSPETLAADWPPTMQIMRLIPQDYMNQKDYQRKAELLVFRPLTQHDFLVQLAEKKLCAVIQLPSQTLLLASTEKPGRMIGMLFPGDMVQIKPQVSSQQQQAAAGGTAAQAHSLAVGQSGLVSQNHSQSGLSQNHSVGQSGMSQGGLSQGGLSQGGLSQGGLSQGHPVGQSGLLQNHSVGQSGLSQNQISNTLGQSGFVQNQLQSQLQNQLPTGQQITQARSQLMTGAAGLHNSSFLP
ncbi:hypothetical protein AXG93_3242s1570 [Marchantia polymorpha subsp. ruderalis]|uniref:Mediator of RNA polymerase II transcription subunit 25 n=1 Tax=Marchantia polymorpha subsp. ruderalis TaxID=1480154 RepID=A0A176WI13_MARPO|nr:hypothetical protein AXG93_3242s1570 [Marchantia polymorpha subsp. ruderalis]